MMLTISSAAPADIVSNASAERTVTRREFSGLAGKTSSSTTSPCVIQQARPFDPLHGLRVALAIATAGVISACSPDTAVAPPLVPLEEISVDVAAVSATQALLSAAAGPSSIAFSTYDGSGQVVHPDVVSFPTPWNGHRLWNAITPYPNSAIQFENPSLFASDDGDSWRVPGGVINPLARTARGYLSDPDMVYEPKSNQLWLYYREVENHRDKKTSKILHAGDHVWLTTSSDAVKWSAPRRVVSEVGKFVVSPSIVRMSDTQWSMYQIDAGRDGCSARSSRVVVRKSTNGVTWNAASVVGLVQVGYVPWHLDVQYVESRHEYWALVAAYQAARGCTTTSLFLATSQDGKTWTTYPSPIMAPGEIPQFATAVYRSTFAYAADDSVTIWYSGAQTVRTGSKGKPAVLAWSAAVSHTTAAAIFARVNDKTRTVRLSVSTTVGSVVAPATSVP